MLNGSGPLYDTLHALVEGDGEPTPVHRFLAGLPALLRERDGGAAAPRHDRLRARARAGARGAGEAYDTVCYLAAGEMRGSFCHIAPDGERDA